MTERCASCFGRGHRFRSRNGNRLYAYPCPACGGRGQKELTKRPGEVHDAPLPKTEPISPPRGGRPRP